MEPGWYYSELPIEKKRSCGFANVNAVRSKKYTVPV